MSRSTPAVPLPSSCGGASYRCIIRPLHEREIAAKDGLILPEGSPLPRFCIRLAELWSPEKRPMILVAYDIMEHNNHDARPLRRCTRKMRFLVMQVPRIS